MARKFTFQVMRIESHDIEAENTQEAAARALEYCRRQRIPTGMPNLHQNISYPVRLLAVGPTPAGEPKAA